MCFRITRCCCFTNTKDGSFAVGIYTSILSLISIIMSSVVFSQFESTFRQGKYEENVALGLNIIRINLIVSLVLYTLCLFISFLLLYGVKKDNRLCLLPWLIWMAIIITFELVLFILLFISMFSNGYFAIGMIFWGLYVAFDIYCYSCVYSQYKTLSEPVNLELQMHGKV